MEPSLLIIGSPRCGTTWMYRTLQQHPDVLVPLDKETDFFYHHKWMQKLGLKGYHALFVDAQGNPPADPAGKVAVESCPQYCKLDRGMIQKLHTLYPEIRIMQSIREPVSRTWSLVSRMRIDRPITDEAELKRQLPAILRHVEKARVWRCNDYAAIIDRWQPVFGNRFKFIVFDDLKKDADAFRSDFLGFVGVDPAWTPPVDQHKSATDRNIQMPELFAWYVATQSIEMVRRLNEKFDGRVDGWVEKLEGYLGQTTPTRRLMRWVNQHLLTVPERVAYSFYAGHRVRARNRVMADMIRDYRQPSGS
ncbi:MAG: sulfotransferase [Planctomycetota bacterium]